MKKFVLALLIGTVALAPAFAAAQTGSGSGGSGTPGTSNPSGSGSSGGSGSTGSMPSTQTPGSSSGSGSSAPSASPSGTDLSKFKTQADCEKAGGMWSDATQKCAKK
jgi:hypothetical protein